MIRIAITAAAYDAIASALPEDAPQSPVHRQGGQCLARRNVSLGRRLIVVSPPNRAPVKKMSAAR